jgi:hypothetical protein
MKSTKSFRTGSLLLLAAVALGGAGATLGLQPAAHADSTKPNAPSDPPQVRSLTALLDGFHWGMPSADVLTMFTKNGGIIDKDYDPLLRKVQPGVQMTALEADRENKKGAIAQSLVRFDFPTGYDGTALHSEYSYKNNESLMFVDRAGIKRYFFYFGKAPGDRLWKIYDEVPLVEGGQMGQTFADAVNKVQAALSVAGRVRAADPDHGVDFTTVDWQDGTTHLRLVDRSAKEHVVGRIVEERSTLNALPQLRANRPEDPNAIDPSIAAITHGSISDPNSQGAPAASGSAAKPPKKK